MKFFYEAGLKTFQIKTFDNYDFIAQRNQAIGMLDCGTSNRKIARFLLSSTVHNYSNMVQIPVNRNGIDDRQKGISENRGVVETMSYIGLEKFTWHPDPECR